MVFADVYPWSSTSLTTSDKVRGDRQQLVPRVYNLMMTTMFPTLMFTGMYGCHTGSQPIVGLIEHHELTALSSYKIRS